MAKKYYSIDQAHEILPGIKESLTKIMKLQKSIELLKSVSVTHDDSFEDAHTSWIDAIDNYERFNGISENAIKLLGEEQSLIELKNQFHLLYEKHGQQFDGKLINTDRLNIRLPAHLNEDVPWSSGTYVTADILSDNKFSVFWKKLGVP